jgi:dipeptidase
MVSLGATSANGQTIFAKNSDMPADDCQPLVLRGRARHAPGSQTKCQFVALPETPVTYRHVGSKPHWCWGYEQGFNEHQVAIGNETLPSRLGTVDEPKLIGMEIVRLALERASSAREAVDVMESLVERYGQGEFKNPDNVHTYDNSYLVADPHKAFVLEAVGHDWAEKEVHGAQSISNAGTLGTDANRVSTGASDTAARLGLFDLAGGNQFSFVEAFADLDNSRSGIARQRRSAALLSKYEGRIDARLIMRILGDHSDGTRPDEPFVEDVGGPVSVCAHRNIEGMEAATAASLVADLCSDGSRLPVYWCCLSSPCMSLFYPVFIEGDLPEVLSIGNATPSADSPWWVFRELARSGVDQGSARQREIRDAWEPLQDELFESAYEMAVEGKEAFDNGKAEEARRVLTEYMERSVSRMLEQARELA